MIQRKRISIIFLSFIFCAGCSQQPEPVADPRLVKADAIKIVGLNDAALMLSIEGVSVNAGSSQLIKRAEMQIIREPDKHTVVPSITRVWRTGIPSAPYRVEIDGSEIVRTALPPNSAK